MSYVSLSSSSCRRDMLVGKGKKRYIWWGIGKQWFNEKKRVERKIRSGLSGICVTSCKEIYKNKNYNCVSTQQIIIIFFITIEVSNISYVKRKLNK